MSFNHILKYFHCERVNFCTKLKLKLVWSFSLHRCLFTNNYMEERKKIGSHKKLQEKGIIYDSRETWDYKSGVQEMLKKNNQINFST